jgi:DinB superfamily
MTTKEEVITAIEASETRVNGLAPALLAHAEARLPDDSEWNVRQALSHVAARANAVPLAFGVARRVQAAQAQGASDWRGSTRPADINQAQIEERLNLSVAELLTELHAGHQAALAAVREMPQDLFDQRVPRFTGEGDMSLGELIQRAGSGHENEHLDQIERAIANIIVK